MLTDEMKGRVNVLLRRVDQPEAERMIEAIQHGLLKPVPDDQEPQPVKMENALAAISFVLTTIIMSAPEKQRGYMAGLIGALIDLNMENAKLIMAVNAAAAAAEEAPKPMPNIVIPKSGEAG